MRNPPNSDSHRLPGIMPRYGGGGRSCGYGSGGGGIYSSGSSSSGNTKNAATLVGLSRWRKNWDSLLEADPDRCQIIFDFYEECMSTKGTNTSACDYMQEDMASCDGVERTPRQQSRFADPMQRSVVQMRKEDEEFFQWKATAAGFANLDEYFRHVAETDPVSCRLAYKMYNECLKENGKNCDYIRNKCPEFKQAPPTMP